MNKIKEIGIKVAMTAALFALGLTLMPNVSYAGCQGRMKLVNSGSRALIVRRIEVDIKHHKGKGWYTVKSNTIVLKAGESKTFDYRGKMVFNCGKSRRSFRITYKAQQGTSTESTSSTNYLRGKNFVITRTGRKSFKLTKM